LIAQLPSSLAPFAIINKLLPEELKNNLLNRILGSNADEIGYPVYYDKCRYSAFKRAAERSGFQVECYLATFPSRLAAILDFCSRYFYCHRCSTLFASYAAQKIWHLTTSSFCAVLETISRLNCHGILISKASNEQGPSMFTMPNGRYPARIDGSLTVQRGRSTENESSR
jgi:hypothetical protein